MNLTKTLLVITTFFLITSSMRVVAPNPNQYKIKVRFIKTLGIATWQKKDCGPTFFGWAEGMTWLLSLLQTVEEV